MESSGEHAEVAARGALVAEEGFSGVEFESPLGMNLRFHGDGIESAWIRGFGSRVLRFGEREGGRRG